MKNIFTLIKGVIKTKVFGNKSLPLIFKSKNYKNRKLNERRSDEIHKFCKYF